MDGTWHTASADGEVRDKRVTGVVRLYPAHRQGEAVKETRTTSGVLFTETACGVEYLSTNKHQHGQVPEKADDHSSWCLSRVEEAEAFCESTQTAARRDLNGNYWHTERVGARLRRLGTADEKLALFQAPSAELSAWHGHPRGHRGRVDYPDATILRQLKDAGIITNVEYRRVRIGNIP